MDGWAQQRAVVSSKQEHHFFRFDCPTYPSISIYLILGDIIQHPPSRNIVVSLFLPVLFLCSRLFLQGVQQRINLLLESMYPLSIAQIFILSLYYILNLESNSPNNRPFFVVLTFSIPCFPFGLL